MVKKIIPNDVLVNEIDKFVKEGLQVTFKPKGNSMLPFIVGERDSVVLKSPENIKKGDIVLAKVGVSHYVLHRVIAMRDDRITLMGDGNIVGTERCRLTDIVAVAIKINKGGKEIDCRSKFHFCKAGIWRMLKPVRRYLLAIYRRIIL